MQSIADYAPKAIRQSGQILAAKQVQIRTKLAQIGGILVVFVRTSQRPL